MHLNFPKIYQYKGLTFEWNYFCGPLFVRRKDFEPIEYEVSRRWWSIVSKFGRLSKEEQATYRVF